MDPKDRASFENWINLHRPETAELIKSVENTTITEEDFIVKYKALGIERTAPAKGKGIYRFLKKVGFIS